MKKIANKNGHTATQNGKTKTTMVLDAGLLVGGGTVPRPRKLNPESTEERKKRLAKRKALTLKIFQLAYEDRNRATSK